MAIYNRWAFKQLYKALDTHIPDETYRANVGLFFLSIHGTLVHLLIASKLWYMRLCSSSTKQFDDEHYPYEINSYWSRPANQWEEAVTDRNQLYQQILNECDRWIDYVRQLNCEILMMEEKFTYFDTNGNQQERILSEALDHVFNHNTHHRGQITAIITKFKGQDGSPVLDLTAMPKDEYDILD